MEVCNIQPNRHDHFKFKICVSGASEMVHLPPGVHELGKELGKQIVLQGGVLLTGATTGFSFWASMGAKEAGGISIGFSPAKNEKEHVEVYKLPIDFMDTIVYTGFGFPGRDLLLARSSDAIVNGPGQVGTFHEFSIASEDEKPIGILQSDYSDTDETIALILNKTHRDTKNVFYDSDPKNLVSKLIESLKKKKINDTNCKDPYANNKI